MHKKALTVAIAGALAVPMAAHAIDVELSGRVSRALFINDSEMADGTSSTNAEVQDNGSSGSRFRVKGTGEMMGGGTAGVLLEYSSGASGGDSPGIRYADTWFAGGFGKVSIGQGDQGGEGSVYKGSANVIGTGHGQDHNGVAAGYYTSLDGGAGRNERLRYDTPALGPLSAAISIGNGDQVSAGLSLSQDFGGASFSAGVGAVQWPGEKSTVSASAGAALANGLKVSAAWGKGKHYMGALDMGDEGTPGKDAVMMDLKYLVDPTDDFNPDQDGGQDLASELARLVPEIPADEANGYDSAVAELDMATLVDRYRGTMADGSALADDRAPLSEEQQMQIRDLLAHGASMCDVTMTEGTNSGIEMCGTGINLGQLEVEPAVEEIPATPDMQHVTDPSFYQVGLSYAFGDTSVGISWYKSNDMNRMGSELTAIGAGVNHNLPKLNTSIYAAAQNYSIEDAADPMGKDTDDTVVMIGVTIKF